MVAISVQTNRELSGRVLDSKTEGLRVWASPASLG